MRKAVPIFAAIALLIAAILTLRQQTPAPPAQNQPTSSSAPPATPAKAFLPFDAARPILELHKNNLPAELKAKTVDAIERVWPEWVARHDAAIRARLERGDEDSIVNLWMYGTTFTTLPRATARDIAKIGGREEVEGLLLGRLEDLVNGLAAPEANERLRFARHVLERKGIDLMSVAGREAAKRHLVEARERAIAENARYRRLLQSASLLDEQARLKAYAGVYRNRGLSSDTSILVDFAVDEALQAIKTKNGLGATRVRRVGVVGPGLDFADKVEGYDFYPQQTIQPFAIVDSLIRAGLAAPDDLRVTTFDLSPRVNQHLDAARGRARGGEAYVLQLPLDRDVKGREWSPELVKYWQRFGEAIGEPVEPIAPPAGAGDVRLRAVRVRPTVVLSIVPQDLNIVLERVDPLADDERFDLIVATNILVYYDELAQALAVANVAHMLRPGGLFLTNYAVSSAPSMQAMPALTTKVFWDRQHNGDTMLAYRRQ